MALVFFCVRGVVHDLRMKIDAKVPGDLNGKPPAQFGAGRVCSSCTTVLSRYNPDPICSSCAHEERRLEAEDMKAKITSQEAADLLGISKPRLSQIAKQGKVLRIGRGKLGVVYYDRASVEAFRDQRGPASAPEIEPGDASEPGIEPGVESQDVPHAVRDEHLECCGNKIDGECFHNGCAYVDRSSGCNCAFCDPAPRVDDVGADVDASVMTDGTSTGSKSMAIAALEVMGDDELAAMAIVHRALRPLDREAMKRVIAWCEARLDVYEV